MCNKMPYYPATSDNGILHMIPLPISREEATNLVEEKDVYRFCADEITQVSIFLAYAQHTAQSDIHRSNLALLMWAQLRAQSYLSLLMHLPGKCSTYAQELSTVNMHIHMSLTHAKHMMNHLLLTFTNNYDNSKGFKAILHEHLSNQFDNGQSQCTMNSAYAGNRAKQLAARSKLAYSHAQAKTFSYSIGLRITR